MLGYIIQMSEEQPLPLPVDPDTIKTEPDMPEQPSQDLPAEPQEDEEYNDFEKSLFLYKCQRCNESFADQAELAFHIREHIIPTKKRKRAAALYKCKICKVGFQTVSNYNRHMKRHIDYRVKCPECAFCTYRGDILQTHLMSQHGTTMDDAKALVTKADIPLPIKDEEPTDRRKKKPGRKKKPVPVDSSEDDISDEEKEEGEIDRKAQVDNVDNVVEEEDPSDTVIKMLKEEELLDREEGELINFTSPTRVQPRRSLKGIRTTGSLCGSTPQRMRDVVDLSSDEEEDGEAEVEPEAPAPIPPGGRKRGRPRKKPLVEQVELDPNAAPPPKRKRGRPRKKPLVEEAAMEENDNEIAKGDIDAEVEDADRKEFEEITPEPAEEFTSDKEAGEITADGDNDIKDISVYKEEGEIVAENDVDEKSDLTESEHISEMVSDTQHTDVPEDLGKEITSCKSESSENPTVTTEATDDNDNTDNGNMDNNIKTIEESNGLEQNSSEKSVINENETSAVDVEDNKDKLNAEDDLDDDGDENDNDYVEEPVVKRRRGRPRKNDPTASNIIQFQRLIRKVGSVYQCTICGKKFSQRKYVKLHLPKHTSKFKCDGCGKKFVRNESLLNHVCVFNSVNDDIVKESNGCYSCVECGKAFSSPEYVKRHFEVHTSAWKCEKCTKAFSRRHLLLDHICLKEGKEIYDNHECEICKQCFRSLKYLFRHMAMHTDIFKCHNCERTFSRKDSLQRHVLRCCPDKSDLYNIYDCKNCKKTFSTKLGLENHSLHCANYSCDKCRVAFFTIENLEKHECHGTVARENASMQFPCQECGQTYASINYLRRHEESHKGAFTCSMCEKSFSRKEEQKLHEHLCYAINHLETNAEVECSLCTEKFNDSKAYRDHQHAHSHPFRCEKCYKRFIKIGTLTTHTCAEHPTDEDCKFPCPMCTRSFRSAMYLQRHMALHDKPQFVCEYCQKTFFRKDYLNNHICKLPDGSAVRLIRKKDRVFIKENLVCHLCGRTFTSASNLNKHMMIHGEKQNCCPHCGKKFHYPTYLKEHIKTVHQKAYQFQCSDCGKIMHSKTGLAAHIKQFHSAQIELFQCATCQKTFRQKGNLKTHMYSHTKEKTFKCEYCPKKFKYPDQLTRHRLEHTMTNKLNCEFCDKEFCRNYQLVKHVQMYHSGVVYVCDICNERCTHKHTIIRHYKRKHPEVSGLFDEHPNYLSNLQQEQANAEAQAENKNIITTIIEPQATMAAGVTGEEQQLYTVAEIQTQGDNYLPHVAAEALQNLSNTIIASENEGGTLSIPSTIEGPDGQQTVVILQIVNPEEEGAIQEIQEIHEVQEVQVAEQT